MSTASFENRIGLTGVKWPLSQAVYCPPFLAFCFSVTKNALAQFCCLSFKLSHFITRKWSVRSSFSIKFNPLCITVEVMGSLRLTSYWRWITGMSPSGEELWRVTVLTPFFISPQVCSVAWNPNWNYVVLNKNLLKSLWNLLNLLMQKKLTISWWFGICNVNK